MKLAIIGCGVWGSALSIALADNFQEILLLYRGDKKQLNNTGHPKLGIPYPKNVLLSDDYNKITKQHAILIATPSHAFVSVIKKLKTTKSSHIAWATKGFSNGKLLHEVFTDILPNNKCCALSGPSFAIEVAGKKPTTLVVASTDNEQCSFWSKSINTEHLRTYITNDIVGVEIGGATKNALAIAAGIASGLGFGANTISAIMTRGLVEMTKLGIVLGAKPLTFQGLSGIGDLAITCFDDTSRNRLFGKLIANNNNIKSALKSIGETVEGINSLQTIISLAAKYNIEMPICEQVYKIIYHNLDPQQAIIKLMSRKIKYE